jgi:hypothetical protein
MYKRAKNALTVSVTGAVAVGALATGLVMNAGADTARAEGSQANASRQISAEQAPRAAQPDAAKPEKAEKAEKAKKTMPAGVSTGTSFWDPETASGRPMRYQTIASPYWPLGTEVKITYKGESRIGVVDDFGPAEWAVAQHSPPAIIDLSEEMMNDFTGIRQNSVPIKFEVVKWGDGRTYVGGGTGYDLAMGK